MVNMNARPARKALCALSCIHVAVYLFVLLVALATSGHDLVRSAGAWYAALAPLLYVTIVAAYAFRAVRRRMSRAAGAALHVAVAPALAPAGPDLATTSRTVRSIRRSTAAGLVWLCVALVPFAQPDQHRAAAGEHTISGRVADPHRLRPEGAVLLLGRQDDGASFVETPLDLAADGTFVTPRLKSGTYFLRIVRAPHSPTQPATTVASEIVRVGTSDVSGVTVTIRRDTALTGSFRMESDSPGAPWPAHIVVNAFLAVEGMPMLSSVIAGGASQGRFVLRNAFGPRVLRCAYRLRPGTKW